MKQLLIFSLMLAAVPSLRAYTDEEIFAVLQEKVELLDPESAPYLKEKDKQYRADFFAKNKGLIDSLGPNETKYYIKLVDLNRNPNATMNIALHAVDAYKRHFKEYTSFEKQEMERKFGEFFAKRYIFQRQLDEIKKLKPK